MKAADFTPEIGDEIIAEMQKWYDSGLGTYCASDVVRDAKGKLAAAKEGCYAYTVNKLNKVPYDYFGIVYQGWSGRLNIQNTDAPEALFWLEHLLDPEGPFKEVLPFLYHTKPEEIIRDRGFVFHSVDLDRKPVVNAGLLWTFIQATRYFFENPNRMGRFLYARENYPRTLATLITLTLQPPNAQDTITSETKWFQTTVAHGEPLGWQGWKRAGSFLTGKLTERPYHQCASSGECFGGHFDVSYGGSPTAKPLSEWINIFEKATKDGRIIKE